jgi:hypothetical protein
LSVVDVGHDEIIRNGSKVGIINSGDVGGAIQTGRGYLGRKTKQDKLQRITPPAVKPRGNASRPVAACPIDAAESPQKSYIRRVFLICLCAKATTY